MRCRDPWSSRSGRPCGGLSADDAAGRHLAGIVPDGQATPRAARPLGGRRDVAVPGSSGNSIGEKVICCRLSLWAHPRRRALRPGRPDTGRACTHFGGDEPSRPGVIPSSCADHDGYEAARPLELSGLLKSSIGGPSGPSPLPIAIVAQSASWPREGACAGRNPGPDARRGGSGGRGHESWGQGGEPHGLRHPPAAGMLASETTLTPALSLG